jgi:outer membrane protein TolC
MRARAVAVVAASTSCVVGPTYRVPAAPVPSAASYKEARWGTWKVGNPSDAIPRGAWWTMFRDPELDPLEAPARYHQPDDRDRDESRHARGAELAITE